MSREITIQYPAVTTALIGSNEIQTVNARELHKFLGIGKDFSTWVKDRIQQYNFVENQDYVKTEEVSSPKSGSTKARPQNMIEYHLSLDMAKELCMVERNDKGKQARAYFIECERKLKATTPNLDYSSPEVIIGVITTMQAKLERATALIDEHLTHMTVDEWRSLAHKYLVHGERVRLGQRTAKLCRAQNVPIGKQSRILTNKEGEKSEVVINVYPKDILDEAARQIGV